uniref:Folliculin-interacting protein middle domain-containing protein n=1 Tax=Ditylenchus dipsaci TaxID=166011 RepID=A0A915DKG3_9BILA
MSSDSDSQSHYSTIRSLDAIRDMQRGSLKTSSYSNTDPPEGFARLRNSSLQLDGGGDSLVEELRTFSPNHGSSLLIGNRSRISSCSSMNENIHTIEKEILKLVTQIHKAVATNTKFIPLVYEGWTEFCASICLLHNALRLKTPAWLSLTNPSLQESTATEFCQTLARLSDQLNTKDTKFFLSTLLSSVLMNHLAWVARTSVIDGRRNPYNAMMAQFLELSGGVGIGNRFAKTLILGENARLIAEILFVLSYFIRCSSVESKRNEIMTPESLSPLKSMAEDNPIDSVWQSKQFMPSSGERKETINGSYSMKTFSPPTTVITVPSNGVTESMDTICSSYDRNTESLTPPPSKTRALAVTPAKRAFLPKQDSSTSQRHYELTLDLKELPSFSDVKHSHNGKSPSNCMLESPMQSSSEMNLCSGSSIERSPSTDFGRSLLAGVCTDYSTHFVCPA